MSITRWFRRHRGEDLDEELQGHLRMATEDRVERGETRDEAMAAARREFGNIGLVREVTRDMWGRGWLERLVRDVQYACRGLRRNRVYASAAIVTLALGIGATTAIFSILDSVVLRTLPVRDPGRLVLLSGRANHNWTYPIWEEIRRRPDLFGGVSAFSATQFDLSRSGETEMVEGLWTNGRFFDVLGHDPHPARREPIEEPRKPECVVGMAVAADDGLEPRTPRSRRLPFTMPAQCRSRRAATPLAFWWASAARRCSRCSACSRPSAARSCRLKRAPRRKRARAWHRPTCCGASRSAQSLRGDRPNRVKNRESLPRLRAFLEYWIRRSSVPRRRLPASGSSS